MRIGERGGEGAGGGGGAGMSEFPTPIRLVSVSYIFLCCIPHCAIFILKETKTTFILRNYDPISRTMMQLMESWRNRKEFSNIASYDTVKQHVTGKYKAIMIIIIT